MVIVAVKEDPSFAEMGLRYFNEDEWPQDGYMLIRRVATDMTAAQLARLT